MFGNTSQCIRSQRSIKWQIPSSSCMFSFFYFFSISLYQSFLSLFLSFFFFYAIAILQWLCWLLCWLCQKWSWCCWGLEWGKYYNFIIILFRKIWIGQNINKKYQPNLDGFWCPNTGGVQLNSSTAYAVNYILFNFIYFSK